MYLTQVIHIRNRMHDPLLAKSIDMREPVTVAQASGAGAVRVFRRQDHCFGFTQEGLQDRQVDGDYADKLMACVSVE